MPRTQYEKRRLILIKDILMRETDEFHCLTVYEIINKLNCYGLSADRRTIDADIDDLNAMALSFEIKKEKEGNKNIYNVINREFELAEVKVLIDAVQASRFLPERFSRDLIRKLTNQVSEYEARTLDRDVIIQGRDKYTNSMVLYNVDRVFEALARKKEIWFEYYAWDCNMRFEKIGSYELSPWAMIWDDEKYYVVGYDSGRRERRHFRLDKMKNISISKKSREGACYFTKEYLAKYAQRYFGMFGGREENVHLRFMDKKVSILVDRFGTQIPVFPCNEEGWSETKVSVVVSGQFFGWLHSLREVVRLVGPENVVAEYRDRLTQSIMDLDLIAGR